LSSLGRAEPYPGGCAIIARALRQGGEPLLKAFMHMVRTRNVGAAYIVTVSRNALARGRVTAGAVLTDEELRLTQGASPLPEVPFEWGLGHKAPVKSRWKEMKHQQMRIYRQTRDLRRRGM
jgi:hypothetical protein